MSVNLEAILLQAGGGSPYVSLFMMVGMVAVMYFFLIRPQAKRAKEQKKFESGIATGEKVITTSGIHGTINRVNEDGTLQLEIGRGVFITIERSAVSMELTNAARKKAEGNTAVAATK
ncbi:MAG: preprotein translocase subunit YajC [Bacteroidetes bacterium]|nr:preprotein translocase subunit YajC [Bacteroidota bacterium]